MPRPRILVVVGTRPEAIKLAPVIHALRERSGEVETRVALTGQHTSLVDQVLEVFRIRPDHDLEIMREGQSLYDVAHGCLDGLRTVVQEERPAMLLVQGDTATVCFASLVAFFEQVRVGHVEAGLRSGNKWAPYPEEIFRRVTDVLTDLYLAPTSGAAANLEGEGVPSELIHVTGNTVVDALRSTAAQAIPPGDPVLAGVLDGPRQLVLLTAHRRESFGAPLEGVFRAVRKLVDARTDVEVVYPVHPNPRVREPAYGILSGHPRIHLVEPLDYTDLVAALEGARLVLTDSGGIQEEAPTFGVPVLVLREVTERPEGVAAGVARLVGTDPDLLFTEALAVLSREGGGEGPAAAPPNPYGDGRAGERIADLVVAATTGAPRRTRDWAGP